MKKLVVLAAILGAGGFVGYRYVWGSPEKRACSRMAELCGEKNDAKSDAKSCEDTFAELRKAGGDDALKQPTRCMAEAQTCGEAIGCYGGAVGNAGLRVFKDMVKGFSKSLEGK